MSDDFTYKEYIVSPSGIETAAGEGARLKGFYPGANISKSVDGNTVYTPYTWDDQRFDSQQEAIEHASNAARALIDAGKVGQ